MTPACAMAAAQSIPVAGDVDANLERHLRLVDAAAEERVRVLLFPELSLTGYELELARDLAFSEGDARLAPLVEAASACAMTVVVGAPVRLKTRLHIGAFIVAPDGSIELYTKHRLGIFPPSASVDGNVPPAEATVFHPGDRSPLVRFGGNTAAVAVCADAGTPTHPQLAAERGATVYLASMFVIPSEQPRETANLAGYAVRHRMAVVFANFGGPSGGLASAGGSAIWSEQGEVLAQLEPTGTGLVVAVGSRAEWRGKTVVLSRP